MFCLVFERGTEVLGRVRSSGRSDGSTSPTLDMFCDFISLRYPHVCISEFFQGQVQYSSYFGKTLECVTKGRREQRDRERLFPVITVSEEVKGLLDRFSLSHYTP